LTEIAQENSPNPPGKFPRATLRALPAIAALLVITGALFIPWLDARSAGPDRVLGGVTLGGLTIARHTRAELDADIAAYARSLAARKLAVTLLGKRFELAPKDLGLAVDVPRTRALALAVGREGGFGARVAGFWRRRRTPVDVRGLALLDGSLLGERVEGWEAAALGDRPFAGGIAVTGGEVQELAPKAGRRVALAPAQEGLLDAFVARAPSDVNLMLETAPAPLPPDAAHAAATEARALLAAPLTLRSSDPPASVTLSPSELGPLLTTERTDDGLRLWLRTEPLAKLCESVRKQVEAEPVNAKFEVSPAGVVSVVPSRPGRRVELARVPDALRAAAASPEHVAELPVAQSPEPTFTTAQAEALGVRGLVSSFTTRHPCCQPRVSNIHRIADILDGTVVLPGETVSVNALVGPRTLKAGFVPAPTIEDGEMVDSIGGGISQFATTLFNALFHGGYDIIERQPHSYWFPRYPMGHEATLSWPKPDIIFKNDTAAGLLLKTAYTDTSITVKLYGDNGGRKVSAKVSERQNIVPAPLEIIPNPQVPPDEEHVKEPGSIGWSVIVSRILTFPDGTKKEEKRRVTYKSRPRRIELHPCRIPEGEKGYTGQPCPVPANTEPDAVEAASH
jgi:vancomycin resistance protein YoaR